MHTSLGTHCHHPSVGSTGIKPVGYWVGEWSLHGRDGKVLHINSARPFVEMGHACLPSEAPTCQRGVMPVPPASMVQR